MYEKIQENLELQNNYREINEKELNNINQNKIINSIIKKYMLENINEYEIKPIFYISELNNTIYGNLNIIVNLYNSIMI